MLWDDDHNLQQNSHLTGVTWDNLRWMFTDSGYSRRYLPLAWLGWNIEHDLFGLTPYSAHLGNILFHLLNTALLFFITKAAIRIWLSRENAPTPLATNLAAAFGALVWALHPLRAEVVAWASGRIYGQAVSFLLISAWCFLRSLESTPESAAARRFRWGAIAALGLSLLTYPVALSFVGVLLLLDWYLPNRLPSAPAPAGKLRALVTRNLPFVVIAAVALALTLWARANVSAIGWKPPVTLEQFGAASRFMQACYVAAYYVWKPLVPFQLSPFYTRLLEFSSGDWEFVLSFVVLAAITATLFLNRRRWPGLWLVWLCYLVLVVPVLGLTEHPYFTSDRYSYAASLPWSIALALVALRVRPRPLAIGGAFAILAYFVPLSVAQVNVWRDTESLGLHMISVMGDHPRRFDIYQRIAAALRAEGQQEKANAYYVKSLTGDPRAADHILNQARKLEAEGKLQDAFAQYLLAAQLRPDLSEPKFRVGTLLLQQNRAADALPFLQDAARLEPSSADIQITLGWALNLTNQAPEAIPHFEAGLRLQPNDAAGHSGLAQALLAIGRPREAVQHLEEFVRQNPTAPNAHMQLGLALLDGLGRNAAAAAEFELVLKLQPDFPGAREALERARR